MAIWLETQDNLGDRKLLVEADEIELVLGRVFYANDKYKMAEYSEEEIANKVFKKLKERMDLSLFLKSKEFKDYINFCGEPDNVVELKTKIFSFPTEKEVEKWKD